MRSLYLRYDRDKFWADYWSEFSTDCAEFIDLNIYPIDLVLKHVSRHAKVLECGFGGGRVIRHLAGRGYDVEGIEYDRRVVDRLRQVDDNLRIHVGDIRNMKFADNHFDVSLCFGVVGGMHGDFARAITELKRVTKPNGLIIVSVMLDNGARLAQKWLNRLFSRLPLEFYAWMDSEQDWRNTLESFDLHVIDAREMVSRYNLFYWTRWLRAKQPVDLRLARVKDDEYKLNTLGNCLWWLHRKVLRKQLAAAMNFVVRNGKPKTVEVELPTGATKETVASR